MGALQLNRSVAHEVRVGDRRVLLHVPSSALFDLDPVSSALLELFAERPAVTAEDVRERLDGRFAPDEVVEALQELIDLEVLGAGAPVSRPTPPLEVREYPLSTLVLNVNTGCNLSCTYCYKEDLAVPAAGERLALDTAIQGIELLLAEGHSRERINVAFFGGEPLTAMELIRAVVDYTERRCAELAKEVDFSLTTNATLLDEAIIDYLDAHRFGIAVSMDGPRAVHDRHRLTVGGQGSYQAAARKVRLLLERYRARPIGARVTLTAGYTDVVAIHRHLVGELGFHEAGFAPVTAAPEARFNLDGAELEAIFEGFKALGEDYLAAALEGRSNGFANLHQLLTDLHEGTRKTLPCGAGIGMLALDPRGRLHLCHRFSGSAQPAYGDVERGIDKERLGEFLAAAARREGTPCERCRIRNLCAGGCYHESYARFSDPLSPTYHYCDLMREWVDFGIGIYARIRAVNPAFFARHLTPRRAG